MTQHTTARPRVAVILLCCLLALSTAPALAQEANEAEIRSLQASDIFAEYENQHGPFRFWPLEIKAQYCAWLCELHGGPVDGFQHGIPGEGDLTQDEALALAQQALAQQYPAATDEVFARMTVWYMLNIIDPTFPVYTVFLEPTDRDADYATLGEYQATINAKTGEIIALWSTADGGEG